jgi:hypothetical protein
MFLFTFISLPDIPKPSAVPLTCEFYTHKAMEYTVLFLLRCSERTFKGIINTQKSGISRVAFVHPPVTSFMSISVKHFNRILY